MGPLLQEGAVEASTGKAKATGTVVAHHSGMQGSKALQHSDQQQLGKAGPGPGPFPSQHFDVKPWGKELRVSIL